MHKENDQMEEAQQPGEKIDAAEPEIQPQMEAPKTALIEGAEQNASKEGAAEEEGLPLKQETFSAPQDRIIPYHERYYLKYREGKRTAPMDLEGVKSFLQSAGFDGGELRQARMGKNSAEHYRSADKDRNNQMRCSYCGAEITGVEFFRLPDGRMRCTACSGSVVKTKAEVEELCQRVLANMENFFGASIEVPVSIEVVEERKLKKKIGVPLGTRDSQSMLILGVAINKKKKYSLLLENGAPRISLIATFAHELTHIWQYIHWDNRKGFRKCAPSKRLLIYEGMAKREEAITRNREDEYGAGFRLYEAWYPLSREAMACEDTPFTPERYPFA